MITFKEYIKDTALNDIPIAHQHNIEELLKRVNVIREKYGKPLIVTSGYRSLTQHFYIYSKINMRRKKLKMSEVKVPMRSLHLEGKAIDIYDPLGELQKWIDADEKVPDPYQNGKLEPKCLVENDLWCEVFEATVGWTHFQSAPPASKKRFFMP